MLFQDLFQILAKVGVSTSHKDHILASIRERSIPLEEKTHEDPEDLPKETEKLWIMHDEEEPLESEHLSDPTFTLEDKQRNVEDLHDALNVTHESSDQEYMDPIESWFQMIVSIHSLFIIQRFVASHELVELVPHVLVFSCIYFSNLNMSIIILLLRTLMHWMYSYT